MIGSSLGLTYDTGSNQLLYKSSMEFFDDGPEKPVRIWSRAGRRPIVAVGNSNGDVPMLGFSGAGHTPALRLLCYTMTPTGNSNTPTAPKMRLAVPSALIGPSSA